jgi:drug/metabolite transporter (DMT)-like permease
VGAANLPVPRSPAALRIRSMSTTIAPLEERRLFGIGLVLCANLLFTCLDGSAKWLGLVGLPAMQIIFARYFVHLVIVSAVNLPKGSRDLVRTANLRIQIVRALALLGSSLCNFTAVRYLPLTVTGAIGFTTPLIICLLSVVFLHEQVGWRRWTAIGVGFIGILIIVHPGSEAFQPATLLSLAGAGFYGAYVLLTRRLAGVDSAATQQFYTGAVAVVLLLPFAFADWIWPTTTLDWVVFAAVGVIGFLGHQFVTVAHRFAPASTLAPFSYVQIIFIAALSWIVFNQPPDIWFLLGAPIVVGSGFYIWLRERALSKPVGPVTEQR